TMEYRAMLGVADALQQLMLGRQVTAQVMPQALANNTGPVNATGPVQHVAATPTYPSGPVPQFAPPAAGPYRNQGPSQY
ncbi:hypothetical protein, partial [Escherichia coli]|uniref:hypothetical protein n=1 Tax=Escherichia coli TaxID=562 RepID=UPI001E46C454